MISKKTIILLFGFFVISMLMIFIILHTFTEPTKDDVLAEPTKDDVLAEPTKDDVLAEPTKYVSGYQNSAITQSNVDHVFEYCPFIVQQPSQGNPICVLPLNSGFYHEICHEPLCSFPIPSKTSHDSCLGDSLFCSPFGTSFDVQTINDCAKLYALIYQHVSTRDLVVPNHDTFDPSIAQRYLPLMVYDRFCRDSLEEYRLSDYEINRSIMNIKEIFATELMNNSS